jgi:hypothetical protein
VICAVLECSPTDVLICEPEQVVARRETAAKAAGARSAATARSVKPRLGRNRSVPPA